MKRLTIKAINKRIADTGYELVKGEGYFYFWPLTEATPELDFCSVYVFRLNDLSLEDWVAALQMRLED